MPWPVTSWKLCGRHQRKPKRYSAEHLERCFWRLSRGTLLLSRSTFREVTDGQSVPEGLEIPVGQRRGEARPARRPDGADPAGDRRGAAATPSAHPAGGGGD